ncbi:MAG: L-rhamnose isomerase [Clostridia bacterium]|nr:L-rhamnose isomerase [Clostridia bacterium]
MQEEVKTLPFGDIWAEYCERCGVKGDASWYDEVVAYEKDVLSKRA